MSNVAELTLMVKPGRNFMEVDPNLKSVHIVGSDPRSRARLASMTAAPSP